MAAPTLNFGTFELADSSGFVFIETTGPYSVASPGGWGSPNTAWSTAYYAEITIKDSLGNVIGTADTEFAFTLFDSTPSSTVWSTPKMNIPASSYGLTLFVDGVYDITYTARLTQGGTIIASIEKYVLFDSQFQNNMKEAELKLAQCGCNSNFITKLCQYRALDVSCQFMVQSGAYSTAQELITQLGIDTLNFCEEC